jgi:hypothetical protein
MPSATDYLGRVPAGRNFSVCRSAVGGYEPSRLQTARARPHRPKSDPSGEPMSVLKYAIVAAAGYYAGQPSGRRQLRRLREQVTELARGPQAAQLKERGRTLAAERVSAARDLVHRNRDDDAATTPHTSSAAGAQTPPAKAGPGGGTGFDGRAVAEDVRSGVTPPSPVGRTTQETTHPTEQR